MPNEVIWHSYCSAADEVEIVRKSDLERRVRWYSSGINRDDIEKVGL